MQLGDDLVRVASAGGRRRAAPPPRAAGWRRSDRRAGPRRRSARPARPRPRPSRPGFRAAARPSPGGPARDPRAARAAPRGGDRRPRPRPSASPCRRASASPAPRFAPVAAIPRAAARTAPPTSAPMSSAQDASAIASHIGIPRAAAASGGGAAGGGGGAAAAGAGARLLHLRHRRIAEGHLARRRGCGRGVGNGITRLVYLDRHGEHVESILDQVLEVLAERRRQLGVERQRHLHLLGDELRPGRQLLEARAKRRRGARSACVTRTSTYLSSAWPGAICSSSGAMRRSTCSRTCASSSFGVGAERRSPLGARRRRRQRADRQRQRPTARSTSCPFQVRVIGLALHLMTQLPLRYAHQ